MTPYLFDDAGRVVPTKQSEACFCITNKREARRADYKLRIKN